MSNLLLIDTRVSDIDYIISSLTENTTYILFDYHTDTLETIQNRIVDVYANIGIVSHNTTKSEVTNTHHIDLSDGSIMPLIYNHVHDWYVDVCGNKYRQTPISSDWMMNMASAVVETENVTGEPSPPVDGSDNSQNQNQNQNQNIVDWNITEDVSNVSWMMTDYNPNPVDDFTPHFFACIEPVVDNSSNVIPMLDVSGAAFEYILPTSDNNNVSLGDLSNNNIDISFNVIDVSDGVFEPEVILFADIKTTAVWKKSWKMVANMGEIVLNVPEGDVSSWTDFNGFLESLNGKTANLDFFACNLYSDPDWERVFQYIGSNYSFVVRSSSDNTGYEGDYILESHQVSLIGVYFTDTILGYKYTLDVLTDTQFTSTPTFASSSITFSNQPLTTNGLAITDVSGSNNRLVIFASNIGLYTSVYSTSWSTIASPTVSFDTSPSNTQYTTCCVSNDARKLVVSVGTVGTSNNYIYWGDASGLLAGTSSSINLYRTLSATPRAYMAAAMTADGSKFVVSAYNSSYIYFATWNGSNYSAMTPILDTTAANYVGVGLSQDGTRLLYTRNKTAYWSAWNGSNYAIGTAISGSSNGQDFRALSFTGNDQSTIIATCQNGQPQYSLWNGTTYIAWNDVPISAMVASDGKGLSVDSSGNIYSAPYGTANVYASKVVMTQPIHSFYIGEYTTPLTNNQTGVYGMGMTRVASTQLAVFSCSTYGLFYNRIINGTWGTTAQATCSFDVAPNGSQYRSCSISADGTRLLISVGTDGTSNFWVYWADASGVLNGTTSSLSFQRLDANQRGYLTSSITPDGSKFVISTTASLVYFSSWTGTTFGTLTAIGISTNAFYYGVGITSDGLTLAYSNSTTTFWSAWDGTTFPAGTAITGSTVGGSDGVHFVAGKKDIIVRLNVSGTAAQYSLWDGNSYGAFINISSSSIPTTIVAWPGYMDELGYLYIGQNTGTNITKTQFTNSDPVLGVNGIFTPNMFSSNTTTISGQLVSYRNGTYTVSASSEFPVSQYVMNAYAAFNLNSTSGSNSMLWHSALTYNANGSYGGSVSTSGIVSSSDILGEWIQIRYPFQLILKNIGLLAWNNSNFVNRLPVSFVVLGSNNGSTWNILYSQTSRTFTYSQSSMNIIPVSGITTSYSYFRLIARSTVNYNTINIQQLNFYGDVDTYVSSPTQYQNTSCVARNTDVWFAGNLFSSNTLNVSGQSPSYRNGTYTASTSAVYAGGNDAYCAFNSSYSTSGSAAFWHSLVNYTATDLAGNANSLYAGSTSTTVVGSSSLLGEWIQIRLPYQLLLKKISMVATLQSPQLQAIRLPHGFYILGSNDGTNWYTVFIQSSPASAYSNTALNVITISGVTVPYSYFRMVVNTVGAGGTCVNLQQLNFNGDIYVYKYPAIPTISSLSPLKNTMNVNLLGYSTPDYTQNTAYNYSLNSGAAVAFNNTTDTIANPSTNIIFTPNMFSSGTATISGQTPSYRNGTYVVTASSNATQSGYVMQPYAAFNRFMALDWNQTNQFWETSGYSNGTYTGSTTTTNIANSANITGEWIQIQLPYSIILTSVQFLPRLSALADYITRLPNRMTIVGSNNGTNWNILYSQTTRPYTFSSSTFNTIYFNGGNTPYSFIRLIAESIGAASTGVGVNIQQLNYSGYIYKDGVLVQSTDTVYNMYQLGTSTTLSGQYLPYRNGAYAITASSSATFGGYTLTPDTPFQLYYVADVGNVTRFWLSNGGYNTTTGAYTGSNSTSNIYGSSNISGEWIQIRYPYKIALSSVGLIARQTSSTYVNSLPVAMTILGSNDGTYWNIIYQQSSRPYTYSTLENNIGISSTIPYSYIRLIVQTLAASNNSAVNIQQLNYNGTIYTSETAYSLVDVSVNSLEPRFVKENLTIASGQSPSYKNGTYTISASITYAPNNNAALYPFGFKPYQPFLGLTDFGWWNSGTANYPSGITYTGSTSTTNIDGNLTINGEWIQIQYPFRLLIKNVGITGLNGADGLPTSMVIVGSNDGTNWYSLFSQTTRPYTYSYTAINIIPVPNVTTAYSYLRLIVRTVGTGYGLIVLRTLVYYGDIYAPNKFNPPYTISGLAPATSYSVRASATNVLGTSSYSSSVSTTTISTDTAPPTSTITSISVAPGKLTVAFTTPSFSGYPIQYYLYSLNDGADVQVNTTNSPIVITGLTNGTAYSVKIKAVNLVGSASYSNAVSATPNDVAPPAPSITSITIGNAQLSVAFSLPASEGSAPTYYLYSLNGGADVSANGTTSPIVITGLTNGTAYSVKIKAVNAAGSSEYSNAVSATPDTAPTTPTLTSITPYYQQLSVYFTQPAYTGSQPTYYLYSLNGGADVSANGTTSPITISGLSNSSSYTVKIKAVNAIGSSAYSNTLTSTPTAVPSVSTITSITPSNQQLSVAFTTPAYSGPSILYYMYSLNDGADVSANTLTSPIVISGLTNTVSYSVRIKSVNSAGASDYSTAVSSTPNIVPATSTITSITSGDSQLTVAFTTPAYDGTSILYYMYSLNDGADVSANTLTSPITITGLTNLVSYSVKLKSVNALGSSSYSNTETATPDRVPTTSTITTITPSNEELIVNFTTPAYSGSSVSTIVYSINGGADISANSATSPITITGLTNTVSYSIKIKNINVFGSSSYSNTVSATPNRVPATSIISSLTATDQQIAVYFTTPTYSGSPISYYMYSLNNGADISANGLTSPLVIMGLTNLVSYSVKIKAVSSFGSASYSNAISATPNTVPYGSTITSITESNQQLAINFSTLSYVGSPILYYMYSIDGGADVSANELTSPITITGLTNTTSYSVRLKSVNEIGSSEYSDAVVGIPDIVPSTPVMTSIVSGNQQFTIYFTQSAFDGSSISGYRVSLNNGADISANGTSSPITVSGLTNGTLYSVKIKAINRYGVSSYSNILSATPYTVPSKPTITGLTTSAKSVSVAYTVSSNGGDALSLIKYSLNGSAYVSNNNTTSPLVISNLAEGTPYTIQIKAANAGGDSTPSDASYVYLPYSYDYDKPVSVETNGDIFIMTMRNELNGAINYRYSYDGENWTSQSLPTNMLTKYNPYSVKWTGKHFMMTGDITSTAGTNTMLKSTDGVDFSLYQMSSINKIYDVETDLEYRNTITFPIDTTLALGGSISDTVKIAYSNDGGTTWTASANSNSVFPKTANDAVWNGKIWVAVGEGRTPTFSSGTWTETQQTGSTIATSKDGITWTGRGKWTLSTKGTAVDWSQTQNLFVAVGDGSSNSIAYSIDGVYWTGVGKTCFDAGNDVYWNGSIWVAVGKKLGASQKTIAYSTDGKTWQLPTQTNLFATSGNRIDWNGTYWTVYGTDATYNKATSTDGMVWTMTNDATAAPAVVLNNTSQYLKIVSNQVVASPDNLYWSSPVSISNMSVLTKFAWNRSNEGSTSIQPLSIAMGEGNNTMAYSTDGIQWNGLGKSVFTTRGNKAVWNGTVWVAVGTGGFWCATSYDGVQWTGVSNTLFTEAYDVAWNGTVFVAVGEGTTRIAVSTDGTNWSAIANSTTIFTLRATAIEWTGKAWLAYGSGGNTTANSTNVLATTWQATTTPNLCVTDMSSAIQTAYGNNITSNPSSTYFYAGWNTTGFEAYRAIDGSMNTYYKTFNAFSVGNGLAFGGTTFTYTNTGISTTGHRIIIDVSQSITIKGYHIAFPTNNDPSNNILREWALIGIPGNNTWSNLLAGGNIGVLLHRGSFNTPPTTTNDVYVQYVNLMSNTTAFRVYVLLLIRSFYTDVKIANFDMYYENANTYILPKYTRPIVTRDYVFHPNPVINEYSTPYIISGLLSNSVFSNNSVTAPATYTSFYDTNTQLQFFNRTINGALTRSGNKQAISGFGFDGNTMFATTTGGGVLAMSSDSANAYLEFDSSFNGATLSSGLTTIRGCCYNRNYVLLGGEGGSVITYNTLNTGAPSTWYNTNADGLFTTVNGLASNSGYGHVYTPNAIYLNAGDKLSVITPKTKNQNVNGTSISFDLYKP